jgi:hypothetical protein
MRSRELGAGGDGEIFCLSVPKGSKAEGAVIAFSKCHPWQFVEDIKATEEKTSSKKPTDGENAYHLETENASQRKEMFKS